METLISLLKIQKIYSGMANAFFQFLKDTAPEALGAAIGVAGSLWLFRLQLRKEKYTEIKKQVKENTAKNKNLELLIIAATENADTQISYWNKLIEKVDENPAILPQVSLVSQTNAIRLNRLFDDPMSMISYVESFGSDNIIIKEYRKMSDCADFIFQKRNEMLEDYRESVKKDVSRRMEYVSQVEKLDNFVMSMVHDEVFKKDAFAKKIIEIMEKYYDEMFNIASDDINFPQKNLVKPILEYAIKYPETYAKKIEIVSKCAQINQLFIEICNQNIIHELQYKKDIDSLSDPLNYLKSINRFKKLS